MAQKKQSQKQAEGQKEETFFKYQPLAFKYQPKEPENPKTGEAEYVEGPVPKTEKE